MGKGFRDLTPVEEITLFTVAAVHHVGNRAPQFLLDRKFSSLAMPSLYEETGWHPRRKKIA